MNLLGVDCNMLNKKSWFFIGLISITTIVGSIYFYTRQKQLQNRNPEAIITDVKTYFMNVVGSYILNETIMYQNAGDQLEVFQGGITTLHNGKRTYYDFYADAKIGEVINIIECK